MAKLYSDPEIVEILIGYIQHEGLTSSSKLVDYCVEHSDLGYLECYMRYSYMFINYLRSREGNLNG